ncbi:MAG: O-antigen ligase family protein [Chloroflexota bacterium]
MSQTEIVLPGPLKNRFSVITVMTIISIALAIAVGVASTSNPFLVLAAVVFFATAVLFSLLKLPNLIVVLVTFVIYTNTSVVMIKFHGVSPMLGYALPLLLVFPFLWEVIVNRRPVKVNIVFLLMLMYFSVLLLGSTFSRDITLAMPGLINYATEGLGLYFLLINTIRTPKLLKNVVWSLLIGGAIIGGLSLYQQVTGTFDNNYWGFAQVTGRGFTAEETLQGAVVQPRVSGPIGEKNRFAQVMLMLVPIGLFLAWGEQSKRLRFLAFLLTGLAFVGGSLAFSRGAQVGLLLLIVIMAFMRYIKVRELLIIVLGIVLLLVAFPQNALRFGSLGAVFATEDEGGLRSADGAIQGRYTEMLAAALVFMDNPIVGVGPGMFSYEMAEYSRIVGLRNIISTREAHSLYPGVAAETGLLGFITLMSIFIYTLNGLAQARNYWLARNNTPLANLSTGFFLAIISYMTTGIFLHFAYIRYFWLIIALSVVVSGFRESDLAGELEAVDGQSGSLKG